MYEHYRQPLLPRSQFFMRLVQCTALSLALYAVTILAGATAFHALEQFSWIDAALNAVLIMTGLGLVNTISTSAGKVFTSVYAVISAIVFFSTLAILVLPVLHRLLHKFHLEVDKR
jgi:hypothetical protein